MRRSPGRTEARKTATVGRIVLAAIVVAAAQGVTVAQEASGYVEWRASGGDNEASDGSGNLIETETDLFEQRYNLDVAWRLYPNFTVSIGGLFERNDATSESGGLTADVRNETFRPYLTALLRSAIYTAQISYFLIENDIEAGAVSAGNNRETWQGVFGWEPELAPSAQIRFIRTDNYDDDRQLIDTRNDLLDLTLDYTPLEQLNFYYRGAMVEFEDRLQETTADRTTNALRINYGDAWWDQRLRFNSEYVFNGVSTEVTTPGIGEIESPLFPIAGLAAIDDMPVDGALLPNPLLIDDDRITSAGVNLVYQIGADDRERNLGLDFGGGTTVNTLSVWIDNDLSADPASAAMFAWSIWVSADNLNWTPGPAPTASFGPFLDRFELRFGDVTSRYVKVVVSPLLNPNQTSIPDIFVTELTASRRTAAADAEGRSRRTSQLLTTNLRAQLTTTPKVFYEFSSFVREFDSQQTLYTITNGVSLTHAFTPEYSVAGRVSHEDSRESVGDLETLIYSASFRAAPLQTLQSNVVFSGRRTDFEGQSSRDQSIFLYTTADLYRGISANLGLGAAENVAPDGETSDDRLANFQATLVPHRSTTLNLSYQARLSHRSGGNLPAPRTDNLDLSQVSVTYRPVNALYFYFSYRLEELRDGSDRFLRNYAASWSPFAGGALQILFRYDESYNSQFEALSRISSPRIRWNITDRLWLEIAHQRSKYDSIFDLREADIWTATTRWTF